MTVLGGYLGAGKTTLLNDLLARGSREERMAVVVNDFGDVNVDAALVRSASEDTLELANGCVCCSLRDGMSDVMDRLRAMRPRPSRVLVEVSGVGDPATVAGWADHPGFVRRGVVVCADATGVRALARDRWVADTVRHQLRRADAVLLTKVDLVDQEESRAVRAWIRAAAPTARIFDDREEALRVLLAGLPRGIRRSGRPGGEGDPHTARHTSWSVPLDPHPRQATLERVLGALPEAVVRVKGVLELTDAPGRRTVVQVVQGRVSLDDDGPCPDDGDVTGLVVITRGPSGTDEAQAEIVRRLQRDLGG